MKLQTRDITLVAVYAALYTAMVMVFTPLSFYALQFRIAGVIRPAIAKKPLLAVGYAIGVAIANLFSPFAGIHELVFMPLMSLIAGLAGYYAAKAFDRSYIVAGATIAIIIPLSVSWMLNQLFSLPIAATLPGLFISEQGVNLLGAFIFKAVDTRFRWYD